MTDDIFGVLNQMAAAFLGYLRHQQQFCQTCKGSGVALMTVFTPSSRKEQRPCPTCKHLRDAIEALEAP